jgi:hypothetical protein
MRVLDVLEAAANAITVVSAVVGAAIYPIRLLSDRKKAKKRPKD